MSDIPRSEPGQPYGRHAFRDPQAELEFLRQQNAYLTDRARSLSDRVQYLEGENSDLLSSMGRTMGEIGVALTRANLYTKWDAEQHDEKTGLLNSQGFALAVEAAQEGFERDGIPRGVLFVDLKNFGGINNEPELGHSEGDIIIGMAGDRLVAAVRVNSPSTTAENQQSAAEERRLVRPHHAQEQDIVARLGGDEFGLVVKLTGGEGLISEQKLKIIAKRLEASVEVLAEVDHPQAHPQAHLLNRLGFGAYVGSTVLEPGVSPEELKRRANAEMVARKNQEKEDRAEREPTLVQEQEPPSKTAAALEALNRAKKDRGGGGQGPRGQQQYRSPGNDLGLGGW